MHVYSSSSLFNSSGKNGYKQKQRKTDHRIIIFQNFFEICNLTIRPGIKQSVTDPQTIVRLFQSNQNRKVGSLFSMIRSSPHRIHTGGFMDLYTGPRVALLLLNMLRVPGEIKRKEVELDPQVSPEEIISRKMELGCESRTSFASGCSSTAVQRTLSL